MYVMNKLAPPLNSTRSHNKIKIVNKNRNGKIVNKNSQSKQLKKIIINKINNYVLKFQSDIFIYSLVIIAI